MIDADILKLIDEMIDVNPPNEVMKGLVWLFGNVLEGLDKHKVTDTICERILGLIGKIIDLIEYFDLEVVGDAAFGIQ